MNVVRGLFEAVCIGFCSLLQFAAREYYIVKLNT